MRVGIRLGDGAVGRPAGVRDADGATRAAGAAETVLEDPDPSDGAAGPEVVVVERRDPRGVIPAVLETLQTLQKDRKGRLMTDVGDDSAHAHFSSASIDPTSDHPAGVGPSRAPTEKNARGIFIIGQIAPRTQPGRQSRTHDARRADDDLRLFPGFSRGPWHHSDGPLRIIGRRDASNALRKLLPGTSLPHASTDLDGSMHVTATLPSDAP